MDDEHLKYGQRDVPSDALCEGVSVDMVYMKRRRDGRVFVDRDDIVEFLTFAGHIEAAETIRQCGREWDGP